MWPCGLKKSGPENGQEGGHRHERQRAEPSESVKVGGGDAEGGGRVVGARGVRAVREAGAVDPFASAGPRSLQGLAGREGAPPVCGVAEEKMARLSSVGGREETAGKG